MTFDFALRCPLQPPARSDPVQIATEQSFGRSPGAQPGQPVALASYPREGGARKIQPINKDDEPNLIVALDAIVHRLRQKNALGVLECSNCESCPIVDRAPI